MKKTWHLFVIQLKSRFRPIRTSQKKSPLSQIGIAVAILISLGSLGVLYVGFFDSLIDSTIEVLAMPELAMDVAILASILQAVLFGVFFVFGELFLSADGAFLTSLPLTGRQVFSAKFLYLYLIHLGLSALMLVPPVVLYAMKVGGGILYFLKALLVLLFLPIFPLLLSVVFSIVLMVIMLPIRRKDLIFTIGTFLFIGLYVGGQLWFTSRIGSTDGAVTNWLAQIIEKHWGTIRSIAQPPASWASAAITGSPYVSLISLVLYVVTALIALWIVLTLTGLCYRRFATVSSETAASSRKKKRTQGDMVQKNPVWALFVKEWRILTRSTIYATNSLITAPLLLVFMLFPLFQNKDSSGAILQVFQSIDAGTLLLLIAGVIALPSSMNLGAYTAFSREGKGFWQVKSLPVSVETIMSAKVLFGVSINLTHAVPIALVALFVFKLSVGPVLGGLLLGLCLAATATAAGMLIDVNRPKLTWVNEAEAIKQNMNGVLGMLISFALTGILAAGCAFLLFGPGLSPVLLIVALFALSIALFLLLYLALIKIAQNVWPSIDA
ncbi:MAG TPA: hypothetical protein GX701_05675 [Clostridiales bacterium]|nr:hypothetical protein [Clostridiales bacterium]